jgi:hypothetical protein
MKPDTPSLADLEIRLAKLERQNRRLKRLGLLFLLIAGAGFLLAQAPRKAARAAPAPAAPAVTYDTLVVHRLELRDKAGMLRGVWTAEGYAPGLALYDDAEKLHAELFLIDESPGLRFFDAAGNQRALLGVMAGLPGLLLYDATGRTRAELNVIDDRAGLVLADATGKTRAGLAVNADGPGLALYDAAEKPRAWLAEDSLRLEDAQQFKAVLGVTRLQAVGTGESRTTSAAAVTLFGKDGKVIWRAP